MRGERGQVTIRSLGLLALGAMPDVRTTATFPGQGGSADWHAGTVAILMQSQLPRTAEPRLVVVDPTGAR
jgi:hypothetical protein